VPEAGESQVQGQPRLYREIVSKYNGVGARHLWFTSVNLATQEAQIRKIMIQRKPQTNNS
jgi:hypothetical protein